MYEMTNNCRKNYAVSEVLSVLLLISIAVGVFVGVHSLILQDSGPSIQPSITFFGKLVGDNFIVEHCRGPSLGLDSKCVVDIGGYYYNYSVKDLLSSESKENNLWNIGERIVCKLENISYLKVTFSIIENKENTIVYNQIIQDGLISQNPYIVLTLNPTDIENESAKLWLGYNFRNYSGTVRFSYKKLGSSWVNTPWESKSGSGTYSKTINGLISDKIYIYKAELTCQSNTINGEEIPILQNNITKVNKIIPYELSSSPIVINAAGDSQLDSVTLYYRWSSDNTSWDTGSGVTTWSSELLTNPSFETGDTTGWSNGGGGTMSVGTDCPDGEESPCGGIYYAYWLETNANINSYAYQNVDLETYATYIDAGRAKINATGWFVSDEYNVSLNDEFFMNVRFYDGSDVYISGFGYQSGGTNPISQGSGNNFDNWAQYGITNYTIPTGARKLQIRFFTWEYTGSNFHDAGSADKFSVRVGIVDTINNWNFFQTDYNSPWSWSFNFPLNEGYYEFYSIGRYNNYSEITPFNADALCKKQ